MSDMGKKVFVKSVNSVGELFGWIAGLGLITVAWTCWTPYHAASIMALCLSAFVIPSTRFILLKYTGGRPSKEHTIFLLAVFVLGFPICVAIQDDMKVNPPEVRAAMAEKEREAAASRDQLSNQKYNMLAAAEGAIKEALKDPDSAVFRNESVHRNGKNLIVCGEVNSRNGFGGFSGFKHFVSMGTDTTTFLEDQTRGFGKVWNSFCLSKTL